MSASTVEILNKGMQCLLDKLYFDRMTPEEIDISAKQYAEAHPFEGNAKVIL
jgi:hypothetical protein